MRPIPSIGKAGDLTKRNHLATREPVSVAPIVNRFLGMEGKHHRAVLVDVVPRFRRRDCEVNMNIFKAAGLSINDCNHQGFTFGTVPGVDASYSSNQSRHPKSAPDARSPPTRPLRLNPVDCRSQSETDAQSTVRWYAMEY
jgi:hypothetical protein